MSSVIKISLYKVFYTGFMVAWPACCCLLWCKTSRFVVTNCYSNRHYSNLFCCWNYSVFDRDLSWCAAVVRYALSSLNALACCFSSGSNHWMGACLWPTFSCNMGFSVKSVISEVEFHQHWFGCTVLAVSVRLQHVIWWIKFDGGLRKEIWWSNWAIWHRFVHTVLVVKLAWNVCLALGSVKFSSDCWTMTAMGSSLWMSWAATVWHAFSCNHCCSLGKESSCGRTISYALSIICLFLCMANFVVRMNFLVLYTTFANSEYFLVEYPCSLTKLGPILHMHFDRTWSS